MKLKAVFFIKVGGKQFHGKDEESDSKQCKSNDLSGLVK